MDNHFSRSYSQSIIDAHSGQTIVDYLGLIDQTNMTISLGRIYKHNNNSGLPFTRLTGGMLERVVLDIINKSDRFFRVTDPTIGFSFILSVPSCWQAATYTDSYFVEWYEENSILPWKRLNDKTADVSFPSDQYYPCRDYQSECCEYKFDVVKVNGEIVIKGKTPLNVSANTDYCATLTAENSPVNLNWAYVFDNCSLVCDALTSIPINELIVSNSPCREKINFAGMLVSPPPGIVTHYDVMQGVEEFYNGVKIRFIPEYEIVKHEDNGKVKYSIIIRSITIIPNPNSSTIIDSKTAIELAMRYAINNLTGTEAIADVQVIIPEFTVDGNGSHFSVKDNSNCCSIELKTYRYSHELSFVHQYNVGCSQDERPDIPDMTNFQYQGESSIPPASCDQECYWKTNGNSEVNDELHYLGPINGEDLVIKTGLAPNIKERMRIYADNKIDLNLNKFKEFPKITFDAAENSDLQIKLYRATGGQTANGDWAAYPWWITVEESGFNILSGFSGVVGEELPNKKLSILRNGNIGIGVENPTYKLQINGTSYFKGDFSLEGNQKVNGAITATEIFVKNSEDFWPDYVFSPDYKLQSLCDVESFIKTNGHLPDVPSSKIVEGNGISIGAMNVILLKKIEEITLHLIELEKRNANLENQIEEMRKK